MQELIHIGAGLYRSYPMWGLLPTITSCRMLIHIGLLPLGVPTHRLSYPETNSQGFLQISDLLLCTDLHLTYINTSLSSLSGPWKRQQRTPALSYRQVLTHQYLYLTVSSLVAEAGNFPSPRSRLQGFSSERRLSQSFFREFSRPSV